MPTKKELEALLQQTEQQAQEGQKLIDQGRQKLHDVTAKANEIRSQIAQIDSDAQKAATAGEDKNILNKHTTI